ncbi:MAG TPA: hypothetical protein VHE82_01355 [Gemmatimonadaceae bacterium]|nr:hypothetical protein [Gemmatimonadaceae bacterium]
MSDPSEATQANPHPVSGHRTPLEIAKDEAGAIGQPDVDVIAKEASGESSPPPPLRTVSDVMTASATTHPVAAPRKPPAAKP